MVVLIVGNDSEVIDVLLIASVTPVVMLDLSVDNCVSSVVDSSVVSSGTVTVSVPFTSVSVMVRVGAKVASVVADVLRVVSWVDISPVTTLDSVLKSAPAVMSELLVVKSSILDTRIVVTSVSDTVIGASDSVVT